MNVVRNALVEYPDQYELNFSFDENSGITANFLDHSDGRNVRLDFDCSFIYRPIVEYLQNSQNVMAVDKSRVLAQADAYEKLAQELRRKVSRVRSLEKLYEVSSKVLEKADNIESESENYEG